MKLIKHITFFFIILILAGHFLLAQEKVTFNDSLLKIFTFCNLGPFRSGAWITCIALPESLPRAHLYTFYVGTHHGGRHLFTPNLANAVAIHYYLKKDMPEKVTVSITTLQGELIRKLEGTSQAGINKVVWDMRSMPSKANNQRPHPGTMVKPGEYLVCLTVGDKTLTRPVLITKRLGWSVGPFVRPIH